MTPRHRLDDGSLWPSAQTAGEASDRLRYGEVPDYDAAAVMDAYWHLLRHPSGTEAAVQKLRALRRAERRR